MRSVLGLKAVGRALTPALSNPTPWSPSPRGTFTPPRGPRGACVIRAKKGARNSLLDLEDLSDEELEQIRQSFARLGRKSKRNMANGSTETEVVAITRPK